MWCILTTTGIYQIKLSDLKFHTKVKGWKCNAGTYVYNFNTPFMYLSDTICREITNYRKINFQNNYEFESKYTSCPKENCYCGMDMGIPKGKTVEDVTTLKMMFNNLSSEQKQQIEWFNEDGEILAFGMSEFLTDSMVHIDWYLAKRCNFDCDYCPPTIHDNHSPYPNYEKLLEGYEFLLRTIGDADNNMENKTINYIFHGGEPTLIPCYLDFIKTIKNDKYNTDIRTLTNLTRDVDYLYELNQLSDVTFSVHLKYMTEKFLAKVEKFLSMRDSTSKNFHVKFMYVKEHNELINKMVNIVSKYDKVYYSVTPLHKKDTKELYYYDDEDKKYFKISGSTSNFKPIQPLQVN